MIKQSYSSPEIYVISLFVEKNLLATSDPGGGESFMDPVQD